MIIQPCFEVSWVAEISSNKAIHLPFTWADHFSDAEIVVSPRCTKGLQRMVFFAICFLRTDWLPNLLTNDHLLRANPIFFRLSPLVPLFFNPLPVSPPFLCPPPSSPPPLPPFHLPPRHVLPGINPSSPWGSSLCVAARIFRAYVDVGLHVRQISLTEKPQDKWQTIKHFVAMTKRYILHAVLYFL